MAEADSSASTSRLFAPPVDVVIVGGGIAALSAAWWLSRAGHADHLLLELEDQVGGNAASGSSPVTRYPWGAHYVPLPGRDARYVDTLFRELGVITGDDASGRPLYKEAYLCQAVRERLRIFGAWQNGILPRRGTTEADRAQSARFHAVVDTWRQRRGSDGRPAFTIPVPLSSRDPEITALDRESFATWLDRAGFVSAPLRWYLDYCCRDDFGADAAAVSAWAGLHYFASRRGVAGNADEDEVVTWPEGNAWLADGLKRLSKGHARSGAVVLDVRPVEDGPHGTRVQVSWLDAATGNLHAVLARHAIVATPRAVAHRIVPGLEERDGELGAALRYQPWFVANVTVRVEAMDPGFAWDNVAYRASSLGYVHARHQELGLLGDRTVLTLYWPLGGASASEARREAAATPLATWRERVMAELARLIPGADDVVERMDAWIWGHGMICPAPGLVCGTALAAARAPLGPIHFAHSDMSGLSLFEEAQYHGVEAAAAILRQRSS
jgi:hypothetical protein